MTEPHPEVPETPDDHDHTAMERFREAVALANLSARRARATAYSLLVAGALGGVAAANAHWRRTTGDLGQEITRTGVEATGTLALVLVGVLAAGTLLMLTLRTRGRRLMTLPLAIVTISMVMTGIAQVGEPGGTKVPMAYALAGLVGLGGVVVTALTVHRWPTGADRYARRGDRSETDAADDPAEVWKAMDEGYDPTDPAGSAGTRAEDRPE